jgi:hypothetical protein
MMVMQQAAPAQSTDPAVEDELDRLPVMPIVQLRARYRAAFRSVPPKPFGPDLLGTASRTEFKEKAYGGSSRSAQPPARSDDKGIGVKVLLAIWAAQTERERLKYQCASHAVLIEPGLWSLSPKNGNISNTRRRLSAISL